MDNLFQENRSNRDLLEDMADYVMAINRDYRIIMSNDRFKKEFSIYPGGLCYKVWKNRTEKCKNCLVEKILGGKRDRNQVATASSAVLNFSMCVCRKGL